MNAFPLSAGAPVGRPRARKAGVRLASVAAPRAARAEEAGAAGAAGAGRAAHALHAGRSLGSRP